MGKDKKNNRLRKKTTTRKNMTRFRANIRLHGGWHAPCELPRTSSSSALVVGLWSLAQNVSLKADMYTILLIKEKQTHMLQKELIYVQSYTN
jgi:hypothetical protein